MRNMKLIAVLRFICIFMTAFNVVFLTDIKWTKYRYNAAFSDYRCIPNDIIFEKNGTYDFLTCGKICHFTTNCVSFSYQPASNQCIGCRVYFNEWINRTEPMPGSQYFSDHECPAGRMVVKRERTCYTRGPLNLNFHDAVNHCEQNGAHLVQAETFEENTFLKNIFNMTTGLHIWQGLTDIQSEGIWQWYSTKENSSFTDWGDGELKNTKPEEENCAVFSKLHSWKWADVHCGHHQVVTFCEKRYM